MRQFETWLKAFVILVIFHIFLSSLSTVMQSHEVMFFTKTSAAMGAGWVAGMYWGEHR